ncbi:SRPBCC domain-containing protein [Mycobacterium sp. PS03-16]|nr:SRPBCC domain-containing protein [Mycobacterium sp. PS03-16]
MEFLVPGTPEQVWHAMATGPGMSAWFTPTTVDERVGGELTFDFGEGATQRGVITGWDAPRRLTYEERDWSSTGSPGPLATEVRITSRSGDRCVVRMVHSLFADSDDWDDEIEGFEGGWPGFFEVLRIYLRDYPGRAATPIRVMAAYPGTADEGWTRLSSALGVDRADVDDRRETPDGAPRLAGVVERVEQSRGWRTVMLRLDEPAEGIAVIGMYTVGDTAHAMVSLYLYGDDAARFALQREAWQQWLQNTLTPDAVAT